MVVIWIDMLRHQVGQILLLSHVAFDLVGCVSNNQRLLLGDVGAHQVVGLLGKSLIGRELAWQIFWLVLKI